MVDGDDDMVVDGDDDILNSLQWRCLRVFFFCPNRSISNFRCRLGLLLLDGHGGTWFVHLKP